MVVAFDALQPPRRRRSHGRVPSTLDDSQEALPMGRGKIAKSEGNKGGRLPGREFGSLGSLPGCPLLKVLAFFFFWEGCKAANFPPLAAFPLVGSLPLAAFNAL
jgi:hypothetical protein